MKSSATKSLLRCMWRVALAAMVATVNLLDLRAEWRIEPATEWSEELRIWDPAPELKLSFWWSGGRNTNNEAEGEGTLTWSDEEGPLSVYSGEVVGGKRHGSGSWYHRSGSKYAGGWKNNVKEGIGEYWLKNGDYYKGGFRDDKLEGEGMYVFADGSVYQGNFAGGNKQGSGVMTFPDGRVHRSAWEKDQDTNPPPPPSEPYLVIGVDPQVYALNGKVFNSSDPNLSENNQDNVLTYRGRWTGNEFVISPDWPYWVLWNSGGPVGGLGNFDLGAHPVFIELRVYNPGQEKVTISSAEVDVQKSTPDVEPILEIGSIYSTRDVVIANLYNRKVDDVELSYNLLPPAQSAKFGNYKFKEKTGAFTGRTQFSIDESLSALGVDVALIKEWQAEKDGIIADQQLENTDFELIQERKSALLAKVRAALNSLMPFAEPSETNVSLELVLAGELKVFWTNQDGSKQNTVVKVEFPKTFFVVEDELGAGGPSSGRYDVLLEVSGGNYVRPFPYKRALEPGANDRFVVTLASDESSFQDFRVRLVTTDGREIVSPHCRLHFLVPGGHDWQRGFRVLP